MPEKEVLSPISTRHPSSKLRGNIPGFSPGAKSDRAAQNFEAP